MIRCSKCYKLKIDDKSKCACNVKKFDDAVNNYKDDKWLFELEIQIKNWKTLDLTNYIDY